MTASPCSATGRRKPGRVYAGDTVIAREPDGLWLCVWENADALDADLAKVERFLYDSAAAAGALDGL